MGQPAGGWQQGPSGGGPWQGGPGGGPPQGGPPGGPPGYRAPAVKNDPSGLAIAALVLGLVSWVLGGLLTAIPGVILAKVELNNIERGEAPPAGKTFAQIGFWASLVHIVLTVLAIIGFCCLYTGIFAMVAGGAAAGG